MFPIKFKFQFREWVGLLIILVTVAVFIVPTQINFFDNFLQDAESNSFDNRMVMANAIRKQFKANDAVSQEIQLVGIQTRDYYRHRRDLEKRKIYSELIEFLRGIGTKAVIFDMVFDGSQEGDDFFANSMRPDAKGKFGAFLPIVFSMDETPDVLYEGLFLNAEPIVKAWDTEYLRMSDQDLLTTISFLQESYDGLDAAWEELMLKSLRADEDADIERYLQQAEQLDKYTRKILRLKLWLAGKAFIKKKFAIGTASAKHESIPTAPFVEIPSFSLLKAAAGVGFINVFPDEDGVLRRHPMFFRYEDFIFPSMDLAFICYYFKIPVKEIQFELGDAIYLYPDGKKLRIPIDQRGNFLLWYPEGESLINRAFYVDELIAVNRKPEDRNSNEFKLYQQHLTSMIENGRNPNRLQDTVVIIGENRMAGTDIVPIPLEKRYPAFATHAHLIDNILKKRFWKQTGWQLGAVTKLILGLLVWILINRLSYRNMAIWLPILIISYQLLAVSLFTFWMINIELVRPSFTMIFGSIFLLTYRIGIVEREDRKIRNYFDRMVSPEVVSEILATGDRESLKGTRRLATIFFIDLRGFTTLMEQHSADSVIDILNEFYDRVSLSVIENHGHVNKFIGDEVLALFGAPLNLEDSEWCAIRCAIDVRVAMAELNKSEQLQELKTELKFGIGINTGEVLVGMVGSERTKTDYTALGDDVNLASRLQNLARDNNILIGEKTFQALGEVPEEIEKVGVTFKKLEGITVKGKRKALTVYEVCLPTEISILWQAVKERES